MFDKIKVLKSHGIQYIKNLSAAKLEVPFRGRPEIESGISSTQGESLKRMCPSGAISLSPFSIDLGRCIFCGECALKCSKIRFTSDYRMATTKREDLIVVEGENKPICVDKSIIRPEIATLFRNSLKLRQVSAGGDNSCEMELNASGNVNFDFARYGVEFTASPRHSDGVVITGPISESMAIPLDICYNAIPDPKIVILVGSDAISGGLFSDSAALNRTFIDKHRPDLYIPGNPAHPLTFIHGCLDTFILR